MASLIEAIDIKRKMFLEYEGAPYHCIDVEISRPTARGGQTLVRVKIRNLLTRAVFDRTFKAGEKFSEPDLVKVISKTFNVASQDATESLDMVLSSFSKNGLLDPADMRLGPTNIAYILNEDSTVKIKLFDILGYQVREWQFAAGEIGGKAGPNVFQWDGRDSGGTKVSAGGYIMRIEVIGAKGSTFVIRKIGVIN